MIGRLKGIWEDSAEGQILLDVHGVGYIVFVSAKTRQSLPPQGEPLTLYIETQMREDALRLFGFASRAEQEWFRLLQNVQGVGAKLALAILGSLSPAELARALAERDAATICRAPGVGKKVAERLINELKNKAPAGFDPAPAGSAAEAVGGAAAGIGGAVADAISALCHLGYKSDAAERAAAEAARQEAGLDTAELIKRSLQILAQK